MEHLEREAGDASDSERFGKMAIVQEFSPMETNWDQVIWTESPDGKLMALHVKYHDKEAARVSGILLKEVHVED
jgi:hypothetical protein